MHSNYRRGVVIIVETSLSWMYYRSCDSILVMMLSLWQNFLRRVVVCGALLLASMHDRVLRERPVKYNKENRETETQARRYKNNNMT